LPQNDDKFSLFGKRYTKFHQNRPSFVEDITKKTFWSLFFWTNCILRKRAHTKYNRTRFVTQSIYIYI